MLANELTLAIDLLNTGTTTNKVYTRFDEYNNRTVYISPDHEAGAEDKLTFYRTFPKVSGNFKGTRKTAFKFSQDVTVLGSDGVELPSTIILEVSTSLPVGVTAADSLAMRQAAIALLDNDVTMVKFHEQQNI